jgi:hypothetical protein
LKEFYKKYGENVSMDYFFGFVDTPEGVVARVDQSKEINALKEALKEKEELVSTQKDLIKMLKEKSKG